MSSTNPSDRLEFRVLAGMQAGASLPLLAGEYLIGASARCDIILAGHCVADEHALLVLHPEGGFSLRATGGEVRCQGKSLQLAELEPGVLMTLGDVLVSVDAQGAPWPLPDLPVAADDRVEETIQSALPEACAPISAEETSGPVSAAGTKSQKVTLNPLLVAGVVLALVLLFMSSLVFWGDAPDKTEATNKLLSQRMQAARGLLQRLGQSKGLQVQPRGDTIEVSGYVASPEARRQLESAFRQAGISVQWRVFEQTELLRRVTDFLARNGFALQVHRLGLDALELTGAVQTAAVQDKIRQGLRTEIPAIKTVVFLAPTREEQLAELFKNRLKQDGLLEKANCLYQEGRLNVRGNFSRTEVQLLQRAIADFTAEQGAELTIVAHVQASAEKLPVNIRAVMDGAFPRIVFADGKELMPGGEYRGFRLIQITERSVILEGSSRMEIPR